MCIKIHVIIYLYDISYVISFIMYHVIVERQISRFFILSAKISAQLESFFNMVSRGNEAFVVILSFGFYIWPVIIFEFHRQF